MIGDLPEELQDFLMRTSLLETIDLDLGPVAAGVSVNAAKSLIDEGERLGLLGRRGPQTRYQVRAHPLVRDFLVARLARSIGGPGLIDIHSRIARAAEPHDWRIATHHHLAAGDEAAARRILSSSIEIVLATGAYAAAEELSAALPDGPLSGAPGLILASRLAQQRAESELGLRLAEEAWALEPTSTAALLNLVTARSLAGDLVRALEAGRALAQSSKAPFATLGLTYERMIATSLDGSLAVASDQLAAAIAALRRRSDPQFLGVALSNFSYVRIAMGDARGAVEAAEEAIPILVSTSSIVELVSARLARSAALAHLGRLDAAREEITRATEIAPSGQAMEVAYEAAEIETFFGEGDRAWRLLDHVRDQLSADTDTGEQALLARAMLALRNGDLDRASDDIDQLRFGQPRTTVAFEVRRRLAGSILALLRGEPRATSQISEARALAGEQGAILWERVGALVEALSDRERDPSGSVLVAATQDAAVLSMAAESVMLRLGELTDEALELVGKEAAQRPWRWRDPVRRGLYASEEPSRVAAAIALEKIGESADVRRLREVGRTAKDMRAVGLWRSLARRLAPRIFVEDLGRIQVQIADRVIEGNGIRRKVLALLCLLLSKPRFASSREDVLENLWPDLEPASAMNSLNQSVYFLRRVFEPDYLEETSPGYLRQDGETIWLDPELIDSRSHICRELIKQMATPPEPEAAAELARQYRGRFALDFAYEEWASVHRDSLHAAYLRVIEQAIRMDIGSGHFSRGTALAEQAAEVEPDSDEIQRSLVRLYSLSGAHAAAAERYAHYARALREIGVDPPTFAEV